MARTELPGGGSAMTATAGGAMLTFAGGFAPVALDDAEVTEHPTGSTSLTGWARPDRHTPSGEQSLPVVEHGGHRWAVADVHVDVSSSGGPRDRVEVRWHSGHELEAVDPRGRYRMEVPWLLRARTLRLLPLDDLIDQVARHAITLASGHQDLEWARRLELGCNELTARDALAPRRPRRSTETGPARLLHDVMAAGGHLAATAHAVRARAESADMLARLTLVTVPRRLPAAPDAPVLVVSAHAHTLGVLRACESVAAEQHAGVRAHADGAEGSASAAGAEFDAAREALCRRYTRPIPHRRR
ncbi:hypothetical protein ACFWP3_02330 [Streptomyces sp. NPDC058525]|uniref:hypothetical protein n=1 Tax=Streptomyces sp. NPDC058525 TaxID=3346538 RepID=UPI0036487FD4